MTKLLKKSLAVVISVALCLSVMVCGFVTSAEGNPTITAKVAETAIAGENVEISIYAEGFAAAAIAGAEFTVELGDLAYVALADGAVTGIDAYTNVVDNTVKFVSEDIDEQVTADGALFTITAALPAEAEDGAEFTVSIVDGIFCTAADGEPEVEVDAVDGVVTIATPVVDPSVAINVSPAEGYIGDEIAIEVVAANFDKVAGAQFVVDLAGLEYVSVASDAIEDIEEYINAVDGGVKFVNEKVADGLVDIEAAEGVLFTITAKITDAAESFEIAIVDSKFCEGGEGEPVIENVILAGATVASLGNKGPVEDASIASAVQSIIMIDKTIGISYLITVPAGYDDFTLDITRKGITADGAYNFETESVQYSTTNNDLAYPDYNYYEANYVGIELYEMSLDVDATLTLYKDGEAKVFYKYPTTSVAQLGIEKFNSSDAAATKSLVVDLLNMGAEAQKYFAKEGSDLATVALANADADQSYATTDYGTLEDVSGANTAALTSLVRLTGSVNLAYDANNFIGYAPADLTFDVKFFSKAYNKEMGFAKLGTDPAIDSTYAADYGYYAFTFSDLALYDTDKTVTAKVIYKAGTADEEVLATNVYSIESYLLSKINDPVSGDLIKAIACFSASARVYWPNY